MGCKVAPVFHKDLDQLAQHVDASTPCYFAVFKDRVGRCAFGGPPARANLLSTDRLSVWRLARSPAKCCW